LALLHLILLMSSTANTCHFEEVQASRAEDSRFARRRGLRRGHRGIYDEGVLGFNNSRKIVLSDIFFFSCPMIMTAKLSGKRFLNSTSNPVFENEPPDVGCYKNDFLRSGEQDIHAFAESRRGRRRRKQTSEPKASPADAPAEK